MKHIRLALLLIFLTASHMALNAQTNTPGAKSDSVEVSTKPASKPRLYDAAHPAPDAQRLCTIYMIGDSTMANKPVIPGYPERGWGQMFSQYFKSGVYVENHAVNGRSTKSFLTENRWQPVRDQLKPGDWVIIQFGHNDNKPQDTNRFTVAFGDYKTNLMLFVTETKAHGAHPILCTPVARRKFETNGVLTDTHGDYVTATRQVAVEEKIPLLDMNKRSDELLRRLGDERSKMLYDWFTATDYPALKTNLVDDTHFNAFGASRMCDLAVEDIKANVPELARFLNEHVPTY